MAAKRFGHLAGIALFMAALFSAGKPASAASYLARCPGADAEAIPALSAAPPSAAGCVVRALPIEPAELLATALAPQAPAGAPEPQAITLEGTATSSGFELRTVTFSPPPPHEPPPYLEPEADLRAVAGARAFGPAGRARLGEESGSLTLDCGAGEAPAGLAFATMRVPPIPGMTLRVVHSADSNFRLVAASPAAPPGRAPQFLAKLRTADSATEAHVPLPPELPADMPIDFKVLCPSDGGRLVLSEIALEATSTVPPDRAAGVRDPALWQNRSARLFARAQRWGLSRLYIRLAIDANGLIDPQALAAFVTDADARGIAVWALLSDRPGEGEDGRKALLSEGAAVADYNSGVPAEAQIKGIQIEYAPERLRAYVADPGAEAAIFLETLARARAAFDTKLDVALPVWFPTTSPDADRLADVAESLTVIADRTDETEIRRSVQRFLSWGTRRGRPVQVALETGPVGEGERRHFARAPMGELWLVPLGDRDALLLLHHPAPDLPGIAFRQDETAPIPAASETFQGRGAELREALAAIGRPLGAWPAFAGFAFHGLFSAGN